MSEHSSLVMSCYDSIQEQEFIDGLIYILERITMDQVASELLCDGCGDQVDRQNIF